VKSDILSYRVVGNVHDISNPNWKRWTMIVIFTLGSRQSFNNTIVSLKDKLNQEDMHGWNEMCSIVGGIFRVGG